MPCHVVPRPFSRHVPSPHRPGHPTPPPALRSRLWVNQLEDRTTPTTVNATAIQDAIESGTNGIIRISRDGDTTDGLDVEVSVGGTATLADYYRMPGNYVFIPAGASYVDYVITPIWNKVADTGSRTVSIEIVGAWNYAAGTSATISVIDNADTIPTLVHQESFQLSGTGGSANVSLTVTFTPPTGTGVTFNYQWTYQVQNPTTGTTTWTSFTVPVDSSLGTDDVQNLTGPAGWTGTVGTDNVTWTADSGGLAPGDTAIFSFTTAPRFVDSANVAVSDGGANVAQLPTAPAPRQKTTLNRAILSFAANAQQQYTIQLDMTTATKAAYTTGAFPVNVTGPKDAREVVYTALLAGGWQVYRLGDSDNAIDIRGINRPADQGGYDGIKTIKLTVTNVGPNSTAPAVTPEGQVQITP